MKATASPFNIQSSRDSLDKFSSNATPLNWFIIVCLNSGSFKVEYPSGADRTTNAEYPRKQAAIMAALYTLYISAECGNLSTSVSSVPAKMERYNLSYTFCALPEMSNEYRFLTTKFSISPLYFFRSYHCSLLVTTSSGTTLLVFAF